MAALFENSKLRSTLASQLPDQVSYPQDATYGTSISSYFFQQARLALQGVVFPESASDVSRILRTVAGLRAKAAIRGGGHIPITNAAKVDDAVTIDLSRMNTVSLSTAHTLGLSSSQDDSDSSTGLSSSPAATSLPVVSKSSGACGNDDFSRIFCPMLRMKILH